MRATIPGSALRVLEQMAAAVAMLRSSARSEHVEIEQPSGASGLIAAIPATAQTETPIDRAELRALIEACLALPLLPDRRLLPDDEADQRAIRGRFEDNRRRSGCKNQLFVDAVRRSGLITSAAHLVRTNYLGVPQIEATFAIAIAPASRVAILCPVPTAGNARKKTVTMVRKHSASTLLTRAYVANWTVYVIATSSDDRYLLESLGARFFDEITIKEHAELVARFGSDVLVGIAGLPNDMVRVHIEETNALRNAARVTMRHAKAVLASLPHASKARVRVSLEIKPDH